MELFDSRYLILIITGVLWGVTNVLIEKINFNSNAYNSSVNFLKKYFYTFLENYKFFLCFLLGQLGSVLFYYSLGNNELKLSSVVILANAISIVVSYIVETEFIKLNCDKCKKDFSRKYGVKNLVGIAFVLFGVNLITTD